MCEKCGKARRLISDGLFAFWVGENLSKSKDRNRCKRDKYSREQKRRFDRTELLRKPQPKTEDNEETRDRQEQRRCGPGHRVSLEVPGSAFKLSLNIFLHIFEFMFRLINFFPNLLGRPMNR